MNDGTLLFSTSRYTVPLMLVPSGINHRPLLPPAQMAAHIMTLEAFFTVGNNIARIVPFERSSHMSADGMKLRYQCFI